MAPDRSQVSGDLSVPLHVLSYAIFNPVSVRYTYLYSCGDIVGVEVIKARGLTQQWPEPAQLRTI